MLVGHSLGGAVISEVANRLPVAVKKLIYLSAFLLGEGETVHQIVANDSESLLATAFELDTDAMVAKPIADTVEGVFDNDCLTETVALAKSLLVPHALAPNDYTMPTPRDDISRVYIECTLDKALTLKAQRAMHSEVNCEQVVTLEASHSPFFSKPDALASHLHQLSLMT